MKGIPEIISRYWPCCIIFLDIDCIYVTWLHDFILRLPYNFSFTRVNQALQIDWSLTLFREENSWKVRYDGIGFIKLLSV